MTNPSRAAAYTSRVRYEITISGAQVVRWSGDQVVRCSGDQVVKVKRKKKLQIIKINLLTITINRL